MPSNRIQCPNGPEDFAPDLLADRLFISCSSRRKGQSGGEIGYIIPSAPIPKYHKLNIDQNLADFNPLGITTQILQGKQYLFVISHSSKKSTPNTIYEFLIAGDQLVLKKRHQQKLYGFCNNIDVDSSGGIWVTNLINKNSNINLLLGRMGLKNGSILYYDSIKGKWEEKVSKLGMPNGIRILGDTLFVNNGKPSQIRRYSIARIKKGNFNYESVPLPYATPDNLLLGEDGLLYTTCHPNVWAFLRHRKRKSNSSPSRFLSIDPGTLKVSPYLKSAESEISAASVIFKTAQRTFVGQIFDDFILMVQH